MSYHFRYHEGSIYQRSKPAAGKVEFQLQNLMDLTDITLVPEDEEELLLWTEFEELWRFSVTLLLEMMVLLGGLSEL